MEILTSTPQERFEKSFAQSSADVEEAKAATAASLKPLAAPPETSIWETAGAAFERESFIGNVVSSGMHAYQDREEVIRDPSWNPYSYLKTAIPEEDMPKYADAIDRGLFDHALNPEHFERIRERMDHELELVERVNNGSFVGNMIGSVGAALLDPTMLVPFAGPARLATAGIRGARAGAIAYGAATGIMSQGLQEVGLQATQDFRTAKESFLNIGMAGVGGAALMGFFPKLAPGRNGELHPHDPMNMRQDHVDDIAIRGLDGEEEVIHRSVGAAGAEHVEFESGLFSAIPGFNRAAEKLTGATIIGRTMHRQSGVARDVMVDMMDMGGVLTKTNKFGVGTTISSEDIMEDLLVNRNVFYSGVEANHRTLNRDLAGIVETGQGKVDVDDYWSIMQKLSNEDADGNTPLFTPAVREELVAKYGEARTGKLIASAQASTEELHKTNKIFEDHLRKNGAIREQSVVDTHASSVRDNVKKLEDLKKERRQSLAEDALLRGEPKQKRLVSLIDDDITNAIEDHKLSGELLKEELLKPEGLGRQYGHAQLWDHQKIWDDVPGFKRFVQGHVAKNPEDGWLIDKYSIHADDWRNLGKTKIVNLKGKEIDVNEGATLKEAILSKWGSSRDFRDAASDIVDDMLDPTRPVPQQIMDRIGVTTGRAKSRKFHLDAAEKQEAYGNGYLRTDMANILDSSMRQLAGHAALHEGVFKKNGAKGWNDIQSRISSDYDTMISLAATPEKRNKLIAERDGAIQDANAIKDRLLGTTDIGTSRQGWFHWVSKNVRQANFNRFGAGFLITSQTDFAVNILNNGAKGMGKMLTRHGSEAAEMIVNQLKKGELPDSEFRKMIYAFEYGSQAAANSRLASFADLDGQGHIMGVGRQGTMTNRVTGAVEHANNVIGKGVAAVSGVRVWNRSWKMMQGLYRANHLAEVAGKYDLLPDVERSKLATLGIGSTEAKQLNKMIQKFGETDAQGRFDPHFEKWRGEKGGEDAMLKFRVAVERDMRRNTESVGLGDTPILMDKSSMKMFLQFQTFAFVFMNKFMIPMSQRLATHGHKDTAAISAIGALGASALWVSVLKDAVNGRDPRERFKKENLPNTMKEMVDRSGMLSYTSPYVDSLIKLSGGAQEAAFGKVVLGPTSRFARNGWVESLGGAPVGLASNIQQFGSAVSAGDREDILKKGLVLAPANTLLRLGHSLID